MHSKSPGNTWLADLAAPPALAEILALRAREQATQLACRFLPDDPGHASDAACIEWDYLTLERHAAGIAAALAATVAASPYKKEDDTPRVLLICPPGLDFVAAFFACLRLGVIAVPLQPPARKQDIARWRHNVSNAAPAAVITTRRLCEQVNELLVAAEHRAEVLLIEELAAASGDIAAPAAVTADTIAMLQYTSGSTRLPRGVQVTHGNLLYNLQQIYARFGHSADSQGVIWLPPYHDMGLIGGILQPIYAGFPVTLMSPASFLRRPSRWLQAISQFRGSTSGGPNFSYEYCLRRCNDKDLNGIDLSSWNVAFNGAEAVRDSTQSRFAERFSTYGFDSRAFLPCYGLAEATLLVTSTQAGNVRRAPLILQRDALRNGSVRQESSVSDLAQQLVGCGTAAQDTQICIVDPNNLQLCAADSVGEIWLQGAGVANGYRANAEETSAAFNVARADGNGGWMRTGDLGFMDGGELYITGRLRDLIVIRGANFAPPDIEISVEQSHARFIPSATAAVAVDIDDEEKLVVMQEVERGGWSDEQTSAAFDAIRAAISRDHGLQTHAIVLVKPATLPKTPSGKVQRHRCRNAFLDQSLQVVAQWNSAIDMSAIVTPLSPVAVQDDSSTRVDTLLSWLRDYANTSINSQLMDERRSLSPALVLDFGNQGLLGMQAPVSYGGLGLGHRATHRVIEQLGAIDATLALFTGLNNVLGIRPIQHFANPALRDELLPKLASGRELAAFALTENGAGSHPHAMAATATPRVDGGWSLNGRKVWSGSAAWASVINVFVRQCDASGEVTGISAFAVRRGSKGLRQGPEAMTMGMRAMVQNSVILDAVPVHAGDLLGRANEGMLVAQDAMMQGRLVIAAACIGGMKRCAQLMLRYASRRTVATGRLLDNAVILDRLTQVTAAIDGVSALVELIANELDQGRAVAEEAYAACKILAPELYWQAIDWMVQCLGGRGYIESNLAPQMLRDARVLRIFEGPTETLAQYLGARALRQPATLLNWLRAMPAGKPMAAALENEIAILDSRAEDTRARSVALGELVAWALLQAALLSRQTTSVSAAAWVQAQFDAAKKRLHASSSALSALQLSQQIAAYTQSIGDIEQQLAGADYALDDWLKRDIAASAIDAPVKTAFKPTQSQFRSVSLADIEAIRRWVADWLARQLKISTADIDSNRAFADYGVDSVMAMELAHDLETAFALPQPLDATLAWSYPTIDALAARIAALRCDPAQQQPARPAAAVADQNTAQNLDAMSDAELAALLEAELASASS